ncbi:energy-dependent translational throttle protein EttA [Ponticaulis sp.]|uniref:energy-dependent translational throttle protein EttA n=1 Tax=Ponticaulis sp. TaxID=2020902 RepID=UPI000B769314|nr:energy-dependent translational throttle protein EttA [Ponticaulis sp.]MAJ07610.1 energy-dependent translational throttle protein EttA [Ponticaulis sp.]RPG17838.1 MAG: energy-dependent translational throttle protein EttA [Hyphomonadaceae bacterium TMED125]HBH90858.1 energy-dependent translational throttle protein EttA [Hyphomonadaceae bacterium]HBJ92712.1 energy-dependent translational throttle protein EttA [Hyphomonadaceae bacterium]|tara:strand:+ start:4630 stop:6297 length:1668 start_codon:yes stop_codon:yes gene_type:complete
MASYQYIYQLQGLSKTYPGGKKVFENIHLSFLPDAKIGVVGVNGSGKSSLLRIMAQEDKEFNGEARAADGIKIGYLPQEPQLDPNKSVFENIAAECPEKQLFDKYNEVSMKMAEDYSDELMEEMTALQEQIDAADAWDIDSKIRMSMDALRCPDEDADVTKLSGGEIRRVAIVRLLLSKPDMIIMDEPTNHLDAETVAWLQNYLVNFTGCVILVTHDRYFLDQVTGWILELDRGRGIPYEGNYSAWVEKKAKRMEQEAREEASKKRTLSKELEWVRAGAKARQAKSKARISRYEEMASKAESEKVSTAQIRIPPGPRLGGVVLEVDHLTKGFGERLLIDDLSFKLPPGGIVGVIGPNGAGKSTLFRMIIGQETPDNGSLRVGDTVKLGYVDQSRDALDAKATVWQEISGGTDVIDLGGVEVNSRAYVGAFNFKGSDQQKPVGILSGGERNRVHLAKMLKSGANLLLLDEPTNDLDVETLQALEEGLENFPGCAVVISHDRWFLDRMCTHILAFEGDSHVEWFEGDFSSYIEDKKRRLGAEAVEPKRPKFKKFSRG